jgi:hypothetical protein
MNESSAITHAALCLAVAKRYNKKFALYEYKSSVSDEEADVLVFDHGETSLYEIKVSLADFRKDMKKAARKKYVMHYHIHLIRDRVYEWEKEGNKRPAREFFKLKNEFTELFYIQNDHLGNSRYYVCPWGLIHIDLVPEGWGLIYYKKGKFYQQKGSGKFRSNLRTENNLAIHALRRYASGDSTGIMINTYGGGNHV